MKFSTYSLEAAMKFIILVKSNPELEAHLAAMSQAQPWAVQAIGTNN